MYAALSVALAGAAACSTSGSDSQLAASEQPLTPATCDGVTVDLDSDPVNCGVCANACSSGLCYAGVCADDRAGHAFVIANSFRVAVPAFDRALGNAIFLREGVPNVLIYRGAASLEIHTATANALTRAAKILKPRTMYRTVVRNSAAVQPLLATSHVLVIEPQPQADDATLAALADEWSLPLDDFVRRGGIVIVLDAPSANAGTPRVLGSLMAMTRRSSTVGAVVHVAAHGDQASGRVPLMFAAGESVGYAPSGQVDVAVGDSGDVVIAHRMFF